MGIFPVKTMMIRGVISTIVQTMEMFLQTQIPVEQELAASLVKELLSCATFNTASTSDKSQEMVQIFV